MGLMQWSHVVPIERGISDVLSGPSVKITEVTEMTWLSVLSRLVRIFTAMGPWCMCAHSPCCLRARASPCARVRLYTRVYLCTAMLWVTVLIAV